MQCNCLANTHPRNLGRVHKSQLRMAYIHLQPAALTESCSSARKSQFRFSEVGQGRTARNHIWFWTDSGGQVKVTGYMHPGYTAKDSREALCADPEFWRAALRKSRILRLWVDINVHAHYRHLARYIDINIIVVCRWQQTQRLRQRLRSAMRVFACMCNVRQGRWHGVLMMPFARLD